MIIGFDFDNTIINYTKSFTKLAKLKNLVPEKINKDKISIRNYLRKNDLESEWTILQGEVYGKNIMSAEIYQGVINTFLYLSKKKVKIKIISHKTKFPYLGEKINLRISALKWIKKNIIGYSHDIKFDLSDIYFENTIESKIKKIKELNCNIFVDDLPEVLSLLLASIERVLFSSNSKKEKFSKFHLMSSWEEFPSIISKKNG